MLVSSLRRVLALDPLQVFDAHRGPLGDPRGQFGAKIDWLERTIAAIEARTARGDPVDRITRDVLGPEGPIALASRGEVSKGNFVRAVWGRKDG